MLNAIRETNTLRNRYSEIIYNSGGGSGGGSGTVVHLNMQEQSDKKRLQTDHVIYCEGMDPRAVKLNLVLFRYDTYRSQSCNFKLDLDSKSWINLVAIHIIKRITIDSTSLEFGRCACHFIYLRDGHQ